jgi:hypothetical protein
MDATPLLTREQAARFGLLDSEAYRHACEVRELARRPDEEREALLTRIEKLRGKSAAYRLRCDLEGEL